MADALLIQLEETYASESSKLKKAINSIVNSLPEELTQEDITKAEEEVKAAVRSAGLSIKYSAQNLRTWKVKYDNETQSLVTKASQSTLDVLDNVRDLGFQEIGMRWAFSDGVTYKDWAKYHEMQKTFQDWRDEVEAAALEHKGLQDAKVAGQDIESKGIEIAENALKELPRLKEVGIWKIHARDNSDDFSTRTIPAKAVIVEKKIKEAISVASESVAGTPQGTIESLASEASSQATDAASAVSDKVYGTKQGVVEDAATKISEAVIGTPQPASESVLSVANDKLAQASEQVSEAVLGSSTPVAESLASSGSSVISEASEAIVGTPQPKVKSVVSVASEKAETLAEEASEAILGSSTPAYESVASEASTSIKAASSSASSVVSAASSKVFAGAMAQDAGSRVPILDDLVDEDESFTEKVQSVVNGAGDRFADITRAVSDALLKPTPTRGTVESITSLASDQYSSALAAASSVLYGTEQGTGESISSIASERYAQAVAA